MDLFFIYQYGLGDILFYALMQRERLIDVINFNTIYFSDNRYFQYYEEELELRVRLFKELNVSINYMFSNNMMLKTCLTGEIKRIQNFKLSLSLKDNTLGDYIVFHTKLRPAWEILHRVKDIKSLFEGLCKKYTTKRKIIILGERNLKNDLEVNMLNITTIYDELMFLKENNDVIDLTQDYIKPCYDNLIYNVSLIAHASCNVCFGHGGAFCLSIAFSKLCHAYIDNIDYSHFFNESILNRNNVYLHRNFDSFCNSIP